MTADDRSRFPLLFVARSRLGVKVVRAFVISLLSDSDPQCVYVVCPDMTAVYSSRFHLPADIRNAAVVVLFSRAQ